MRSHGCVYGMRNKSEAMRSKTKWVVVDVLAKSLFKWKWEQYKEGQEVRATTDAEEWITEHLVNFALHSFGEVFLQLGLLWKSKCRRL